MQDRFYIELEYLSTLSYASQLFYIKEQNDVMRIDKVRFSPYNLKYVKDQTHDLCMAAIEISSFALEHVKNQTHDLCLAAVQKDYTALIYVKEQTFEICIAALKHSFWATSGIDIDFNKLSYDENIKLKNEIKRCREKQDKFWNTIK